jgi:hypothetical protein
MKRNDAAFGTASHDYVTSLLTYLLESQVLERSHRIGA